MKELMTKSELDSLIYKLINMLKNGEERFSYTSSYPLNSTFLNRFTKIWDYGESLDSILNNDKPQKKEIEKEYIEELCTINKLLLEAGVYERLARYEKKLDSKLIKDIKISTYTNHVWYLYAIPYRYRQGSIFIIEPQEDLAPLPMPYEPVIYEYSIYQFLETIDKEFRYFNWYHNKMSKQLWDFKNIGFGLLFIIGFIFWILISC